MNTAEFSKRRHFAKWCLAVSLLVCCTLWSLSLLESITLPQHKLSQQLTELRSSSQRWLQKQDCEIHFLREQAEDEAFLQNTFYKINSISKEVKKPANDALKEEFVKKNRRRYFFPYDENRTLREKPNFYINASDIITPEQHYIVTQGPLETTASDFWTMVLEKHSPLIVTCVMPKEDGIDKCFAYWEKGQFPHSIHEWKIEFQTETPLVESSYSPRHRIVKRTFLATNHITKEERPITQLHYENWPDCGVPYLDLFINLLDEVDSLDIRKESPIVVHCSAGIGRSGTFVASHALRKMIRVQEDSGMFRNAIVVNVPKMLCLLRLQRKSLVSTLEQFQTIYEVLANE
jgi:protein tyrosine phosphatase